MKNPTLSYLLQQGVFIITLLLLVHLTINVVSAQDNPPKDGDAAFCMPYTNYAVSGGWIHGTPPAVDITAGPHQPILSPINGTITNIFWDDGTGATWLYVENSIYTVIIVHSDPLAAVGTVVKIGDHIANEGAHGRLIQCSDGPQNGRDCGYHTHFSTAYKAGGYFNPLQVIGPNGCIYFAAGQRENTLPLPENSGTSPGPFGESLSEPVELEWERQTATSAVLAPTPVPAAKETPIVAAPAAVQVTTFPTSAPITIQPSGEVMIPIKYPLAGVFFLLGVVCLFQGIRPGGKHET